MKGRRFRRLAGIIYVVVALVLVSSMFGCAEPAPKPTVPTPKPPPVTPPTPTPAKPAPTPTPAYKPEGELRIAQHIKLPPAYADLPKDWRDSNSESPPYRP